jgi:hypothetical protein
MKTEQFRTILVILSTYRSMHAMIIARLADWLPWLTIPCAPLKWLKKMSQNFSHQRAKVLFGKTLYSMSIYYMRVYCISICWGLHFVKLHEIVNVLFVYTAGKNTNVYLYIYLYIYLLSTNLPRRHTQLLTLQGTFFSSVHQDSQNTWPTYVPSYFNVNIVFFKYNDID